MTDENKKNHQSFLLEKESIISETSIIYFFTGINQEQ